MLHRVILFRTDKQTVEGQPCRTWESTGSRAVNKFSLAVSTGQVVMVSRKRIMSPGMNAVS